MPAEQTTKTDEKPIRVLLVDDHKIIRDGLRDLIESRAGMAVVGDAGNRADALSLAAREKPDVVVLDLDLGADSGLTLIPELRKASDLLKHYRADGPARCRQARQGDGHGREGRGAEGGGRDS